MAMAEVAAADEDQPSEDQATDSSGSAESEEDANVEIVSAPSAAATAPTAPDGEQNVARPQVKLRIRNGAVKFKKDAGPWPQVPAFPVIF